MKEHTDKHYEQELQKLREAILLMGARVERMIADAVRTLERRDAAFAGKLIEQDHEINRAELETDGLCLRLLALRQPAASDLRFITIALKIVTDLERMGDLGVNVCERAIDLAALPPLHTEADIPRMAEHARAMLKDALDAFVSRDAEKAEAVLRRDAAVDELYHQSFRLLLHGMMADPTTIQRAIPYLSVAKYLERFADHATNLAEMVVFMVRGEDIRHAGKR
jgi:phosphate transport system protein